MELERTWRKMSAWALLPGLAFGPAAALAQRKGGPRVTEQVKEILDKLDTVDQRSRTKLLSRVDEKRKELVTLLVNYLDTSPSRNVQAAAIYVMGRHRLAEAVPTLIRWIDFDAGEPAKSAEPLWDRYPAMEALIAIGRPSVLAALELLASDSHELRRTLAVKVIRYVEDAATALFILERARNSEADSARKGKLDDAIARLRSLPPG
jgi:hypothetical protein